MLLDFEKELGEIDDKIKELMSEEEGKFFRSEILQLEKNRQEVLNRLYSQLSPWQRTQVARHPARPLFLDYLDFMFQDFIKLHGDRYFGEDSSIVGGLASFIPKTQFSEKKKEKKEPEFLKKVIVIGHQKGRDTKEKISRNFGMPRPEGYRKALRIMKLAEKFKKPVLSFIDTPGAYPGIDAEERGQASAIAQNLFEMSRLKTPILACVIGEGGSGGALALGVADRILMLSNSIYSVISPEGCASILWKDPKQAPQASEALKISAKDLLSLGLIDEIVPESLGGAHRYPKETALALQEALTRNLEALEKLSPKKLLEQRHQKYLRIGQV